MLLNFFIIYSFHTCTQCDFWSLSFQITFSQPLHIPTESFLLPNKFLLLFTCFYFYDLGSLHEHGVLNWSMDHYWRKWFLLLQQPMTLQGWVGLHKPFVGHNGMLMTPQHLWVPGYNHCVMSEGNVLWLSLFLHSFHPTAHDVQL